MTPDQLLDQIMTAVRKALPRWVPRRIFDAYYAANRARLVARVARSPRFAARGPLALGAAQELEEHPWAGPEVARRIAADHLREKPDYYGAAQAPAANARPRALPAPSCSTCDTRRPVIDTTAKEVRPKRGRPVAGSDTLADVLASSRFYSTVQGRRERFDPARITAARLAEIARHVAQGYSKAADPDGINLREDIQAELYKLVDAGVLLAQDHAAVLAAIAADHIRAKSRARKAKPVAAPKMPAVSAKVEAAAGEPLWRNMNPDAAKAASKPKPRRAPAGPAPEFFSAPRVDADDLEAFCDGETLKAAVALARKVARKKDQGVCVVASGSALYLVTFPKLVASTHQERSGKPLPQDDLWLQTLTLRIAAEVRRPGKFWFTAREFDKFASQTGRVRLHIADNDLRWNLRRLIVGGEIIEPAAPEFLPERGEHRSSLLWPAPLLREALSTIVPFVSSDEARVNLNGALMTEDGGKLMIVGTDGHRLATMELDVPPPPSFIWRKESAEAAPALLKGLEQVRIEVVPSSVDRYGNHAVLAGATEKIAWTWWVVGVQAVFPPYQRVIPQNLAVSCEMDGKEARKRLAPLLESAKANKMKMPGAMWTFTTSTLQVRYQNPGQDDARTVEIPLACRLPSGQQGTAVGLNLYYLDEVLGLPAFSGPVRVGVNMAKYDRGGALLDSSLDPVRFDSEGDGWRATGVVMPVRM